MQPPSFKIPRSVLVVIYTPQWDVLLLKRQAQGDQTAPFWQSVTGSQEISDSDWSHTAAREVWEETGIACDAIDSPGRLVDWGLENVYPIYPQWRWRYAPGTYFNVERVFGLRLTSRQDVHLSPDEHDDYRWVPWRTAAELCFSPSNAEAILWLPRFSRSVGENEECQCQ